MNFVYATDLHLSDRQPINRITPVLEAGLHKFEMLLKKAKAMNAKLIIGGDFFDSPCPSMSLLNKVIALLTKYQVEVWCLLGNHDHFGAAEALDDTAIQVLYGTGLFNAFPSHEEVKMGGFVFYGIQYEKVVEKSSFLTYNFHNQGLRKVLVTHLPIVPEKAIYNHIPISSIVTDANLVLCGHIHQGFKVKSGNSLYYNPGCVMRRAKNEKLQEVKCLSFSENTFTEHIMPVPKPEFNSLESPEEIISKVLDEKIDIPDLEIKILSSGKSQVVIDRCLELLNMAQVKFNEKNQS